MSQRITIWLWRLLLSHCYYDHSMLFKYIFELFYSCGKCSGQYSILQNGLVETSKQEICLFICGNQRSVRVDKPL